MFFNAIFLFCFVVAVSKVSAELDENTARLLVYKSTKSDIFVEGRDFLVTYQIINTGNAAATNIEVTDRYETTSFESRNNVNEDGNVEFALDELAPGGQAVFNVTVKPKLYGLYDSSRAKIKYGSGAVEIEGIEAENRSGYSTSMGMIRIESTAEYARRTSLHLRELSVFGGLYAIPTVIPLILWIMTKSISERISRPKTN